MTVGGTHQTVTVLSTVTANVKRHKTRMFGNPIKSSQRFGNMWVLMTHYRAVLHSCQGDGNLPGGPGARQRDCSDNCLPG